MAKETIKKMKRQMGENICKHIYAKRLISKIQTELTQFNSKKKKKM